MVVCVGSPVALADDLVAPSLIHANQASGGLGCVERHDRCARLPRYAKRVIVELPPKTFALVFGRDAELRQGANVALTIQRHGRLGLREVDRGSACVCTIDDEDQSVARAKVLGGVRRGLVRCPVAQAESQVTRIGAMDQRGEGVEVVVRLE